MQQRVSIMFRGMPRRPDLESSIDRWVTRLELVAPIIQCAIVIEAHHSLLRHEQFLVRLMVTLPSTTITISQDARDSTHANADAVVRISDAFRAARQQLLALKESATSDVSLSG